MITATSEAVRYLTRFSDGTHHSVCDTSVEKGGSDAGFRPHDLLEAALAACVSMTVRMYADRKAIPLENVKTTVKLDLSNPEQPVFRYDVMLEGELTEQHREKLTYAASACPVRRTLAKTLTFESTVVAV